MEDVYPQYRGTMFAYVQLRAAKGPFLRARALDISWAVHVDTAFHRAALGKFSYQ